MLSVNLSPLLSSTLTNNQKEQLQKIMVERKAYSGHAMWQRGKPTERVIIIDRGCFMCEFRPSFAGRRANVYAFNAGVIVQLNRSSLRADMDENGKADESIMNGGSSTRLLKRRRSSVMGSLPLTRTGTLIGEVSAIIGNGKHQTTLLAMDEGVYFEISADDLLDFFECYPGVQLSLSNTLSIGPVDNIGGMTEDSIMF